MRPLFPSGNQATAQSRDPDAGDGSGLAEAGETGDTGEADADELAGSDPAMLAALPDDDVSDPDDDPSAAP